MNVLLTSMPTLHLENVVVLENNYFLAYLVSNHKLSMVKPFTSEGSGFSKQS